MPLARASSSAFPGQQNPHRSAFGQSGVVSLAGGDYNERPALCRELKRLGDRRQASEKNTPAAVSRHRANILSAAPMATAPVGQPLKPKEAAPGGYAPLTPRFWHGMPMSVWWRLLASNRFAISPLRLPPAISISGFSVFNSSMRFLQQWIYGRSIALTSIAKPPIFIIGHWRSGTTLLHEMLVLDPRHSFPTTYQCFAPHHFLVTQGIVTRWFKWVLPAQRPMDNMMAGWDRPQEDEFALCNLGVPSPYLTMAFPNRGAAYPEYLDLEVEPEARALWSKKFLGFMKSLTLHDPRRIVLKSPPHTARLRVLLDLFPEARFIHIARDPYTIFPSTIRLWTSLRYLQGLQIARNDDLEEYVFDSLERMYQAYARDRTLIASNRLYELRYEDLISDPAGELGRMYEHLELGEFEELRPRLAGYLEDTKDYRTNRHQLSDSLRAVIARRWAPYFELFGYAV